MNLSRKDVQFEAHRMPGLRFEEQQLTSFSGLILFQALISQLDLQARLRRCFWHLQASSAYTYATLVLGLIVHLLLGYRHLRDTRFYYTKSAGTITAQESDSCWMTTWSAAAPLLLGPFSDPSSERSNVITIAFAWSTQR